MNHTNRTKALALAAALVSTTACSQAGLRKQYQEMKPAMIRGDWKTASAQLEQSKEKVYGEKDRVMFWLNMGTILHYAGDVKGSQANFVKAEETMQELWTKSISAEASKVLVNETMQSYPGEDFEKVLIYLYTSLNHAQQGNIADALVEGRRADEFLKKLKVHFEKEGEGGTVYTQDAFMLWLVGLYYEMEGSLNDAFLAYKAAFQAYETEYAGKFGMPPPKYLAEDCVRTATLIGFSDEVAKFSAAAGAEAGHTVKKLAEMGEVIIVHGNGESPFKRELRFNNTMPDGYVMSITVPEFVAQPAQIAYAKASAGGVEASTELAEPMTSIVLENFKHRVGAIKARAVARAIVKYAASKGAQKIGEAAGGGALGALVGLAANVASAATEAADLRSWTLLPANVNVARMWLPPGEHELKVSYHSASGATIGRSDSFKVTIAPGKRQLVSVRSFQ